MRVLEDFFTKPGLVGPFSPRQQQIQILPEESHPQFTYREFPQIKEKNQIESKVNTILLYNRKV